MFEAHLIGLRAAGGCCQPHRSADHYGKAADYNGSDDEKRYADIFPKVIHCHFSLLSSLFFARFVDIDKHLQNPLPQIRTGFQSAAQFLAVLANIKPHSRFAFSFRNRGCPS
jgi:hypothetical protein